jgi:hypothetical protein
LHLDRRERNASENATAPNKVHTKKYAVPASAVSRPM